MTECPADVVRRAGFAMLGQHLEAGSLCRLHVNQHAIRANAKDGGRRPVLTVKRRGRTTTGQRCRIVDPDGNVVATLVYSPDKPLSCGARAWVETSLAVVVDGG